MKAIALAVVLFAAPVSAQTAVDGDTIKIDGTTFRLLGIDAPESKQRCGDYAAGVIAAGALVDLMHGKTVTCERRSTDRYGRTVALCRADGIDLGAAMVQLGMAWAFVRYSRDYVDLEAAARSQRLGVHGHDCQPAWAWRAERNSQTESQTKTGGHE